MSFPPHLKGMYSQNSRSLHQASTSPMQPLTQMQQQQQQQQQQQTMLQAPSPAASQQPQQPWNKRTTVMGNFMQQAGGAAAASAIAPNAVGTISASALRRGEQQAMDANVRLPSAPSQPPNMRQAQQQQQFQQQQQPFHAGAQQGKTSLFDQSAGRQQQEQFGEFFAAPSTQQQQYGGAGGGGGGGGGAASPGHRSSIFDAPQQQNRSQQQQQQQQQQEYLTETDSGLPRYLLAFNQTSKSSVDLVNQIVAHTEEPHKDVFDWSVSLVDVMSVYDESPDRVALQQLARMNEFKPAMLEGVVLYDRINSIAFKEPNTVVRNIEAQKHLIIAALVAREFAIRKQVEQQGGLVGDQTTQQSIFRSHHSVTEPNRTTKTINQVAARSVLRGTLEEFVERGEEEAARIQINPTTGIDTRRINRRRNNAAQSGGQHVGGFAGDGGDGDGGYVGGGGGGGGSGGLGGAGGGGGGGDGSGTIQQINVKGSRAK